MPPIAEIAIRLGLDSATRYVGRQILVLLAMVAVGFGLMIWLTQAIPFLDLIFNRGMPLHRAFVFLLLVVPRLIVQLLPVGLFIALTAVYYRLAADSELAALRVAGLSPWQLARPALLIAVAVMLFVYAVAIWALPVSSRLFAEQRFALVNDLAGMIVQEGVFSDVAPGVTIYTRARSAEGALLGVVVFDRREAPKSLIYTAARGRIVAGDQPRVVLEDGTYQESTETDKALPILYFDRTAIEISFLGAGRTRTKSIEELTIGEMFQPPADQGDAAWAARATVEGYRVLTAPLLAPAYGAMVTAFLLIGGVDRRGGRRLLAIVILAALLIQGANFAAYGVARNWPTLAPTLLLTGLLPAIAGLTALLWPQQTLRWMRRVEQRVRRWR